MLSLNIYDLNEIYYIWKEKNECQTVTVKSVGCSKSLGKCYVSIFTLNLAFMHR